MSEIHSCLPRARPLGDLASKPFSCSAVLRKFAVLRQFAVLRGAQRLRQICCRCSCRSSSSGRGDEVFDGGLDGGEGGGIFEGAEADAKLFVGEERLPHVGVKRVHQILAMLR